MNPSEEAENRVLQEEEILALSSIYDADFTSDSPDSFTIRFRVPADPSDATTAAKELEIVLACHLPTTYPSREPPYYELVTDWRNGAGIPFGVSDVLRRGVDDAFTAAFVEGEVCVFEWVEALKMILETRYGIDDGTNAEARRPSSEAVAATKPTAAVAEDDHDGEDLAADAHGNAFPMTLPPNCPPIAHSSEPLVERKSVFVAHAAPIASAADAALVVAALLTNKRIRRATHNIVAWRVLDHGIVRQDCADDGETAAGGRLLHMLDLAKADGVVVVVSRWYGGIQLGPARFKCINNCARKLLESEGYITAGEGKKGRNIAARGVSRSATDDGTLSTDSDHDVDGVSYTTSEETDSDGNEVATGATTGTTRHITFLRPPPAVPVSIMLHELLDPAYGVYLWPSALVLAAWISYNAQLFPTTRILELGCGTALPGLVAAQCGAAQVVLTDTATAPQVLANAFRSVQTNGLASRCVVTPLAWGDFDAPALAVLDAGYDFVFGADVFYEPAMFESALASVARCLRKSAPGAVFVTTYQERSCRRSVAHLMDRYGLVARLVNKNEFGGWGEGWNMDGGLPSGISSVVLLVIRRKD
ncbi:hypothetical protein HDU87_008552 [Geranomyces variabilis]|uniref:RWD domain-containing protein n=1 Tax=Geranomyces variabilis TaxID=109894 RepID=A0AAD5XTC2_9FUNG|nr:hypothetical protein HDU87_008552 [Geranomyces variabilis]